MAVIGSVLYIVFYLIIYYVWGLYELKTVGEVQPNLFDTVIATVLSISLAVNVMLLYVIKSH